MAVEIKNGNIKFGGGNFVWIAGPCSVESRGQINKIAEQVKLFGAQVLRGGAFKARTSPYSFQGLREEGLELLLDAGQKSGLPVVSEITDASQISLFSQVDIIQVGARNMQNFELLKVLGGTGKPVLLKRGFANTIEELLMSAQYLMESGNEKIILCERGIRTFEPATRSMLDLAAVSLLKKETNFPVIVDPSHAAGNADLVAPLAFAAAAAGADGLMIEVHTRPEQALCDGLQAVLPSEFAGIVDKVGKIRTAADYTQKKDIKAYD